MENRKRKPEKENTNGMVGAVEKGVSLQSLLLLLRQNGVKTFKDGAIEIEFGERASLENPMVEFELDEKAMQAAQHDEEILHYSSGG